MESGINSVVRQQVAEGLLVYARLPPHHPAEFTSVTPSGTIGISFSPHRRAVVRLGPDPIRESDIGAGNAFVISSGNLDWLRVAEAGEAWEFRPEPEYLAGVAARLGASRSVALPDVGGRPDPVIWAVAAALRSRLRRGELDPLDASERLFDLAAHVLATYGGVRLTRKRAGRLDDQRLRRVVEYMDAHITQPLRLEQLADVAALSPYHFARSFRNTTRLAPYEFLTAQRMERARHLLESTNRSVAEIANAVGYSHVAHFREQFVQAFYLRPSELRGSAPPHAQHPAVTRPTGDSTLDAAADPTGSPRPPRPG